MEASQSRNLRNLVLLFVIALWGMTAQAADPFPSAGRYVFDADQSTILQSGGFAGVHWTYAIEGQFCLIVDEQVGTARFEQVDANAVDESEPTRMLDPNEVFNLEDMTGTVIDETTIKFTGQADDGSEIGLTLTVTDDTARLTGETIPPPNSADFFVFSLDAAATRKYAGGTGDPNTPYLIATAEQMNAIGTDPNDWDKHFRLTADIDLAAYRGAEFNLIGTYSSLRRGSVQSGGFSGVFDGNGYSISNFTWSAQDAHEIGLFRRVRTPQSQITNIVLIDPNVNADGGDGIGGLVGYLSEGTVTNCHVQGITITGCTRVGGLVGASDGSISNCSVVGIVIGDVSVGGLAGSVCGTIQHCHSTCAAAGVINVGGLVGYNDGIASCSYADGGVVGRSRVGGLVGHNHCRALIATCFAAGSVVGKDDVGGLVGCNSTPCVVGGGTITASFWDIEVSGQTWSAGGTGLPTAEMQTATPFLEAGWDFVGETDNGVEDIWWIDEGRDYPQLWWEAAE